MYLLAAAQGSCDLEMVRDAGQCLARQCCIHVRKGGPLRPLLLPCPSLLLSPHPSPPFRPPLPQGVAEIVARRAASDAVEGHAIAKRCAGLVDRKVVKQSVMTSVYGVTAIGARAQVWCGGKRWRPAGPMD
jgi:hypothetical protein